jgi:hypothetical protein
MVVVQRSPSATYEGPPDTVCIVKTRVSFSSVTSWGFRRPSQSLQILPQGHLTPVLFQPTDAMDGFPLLPPPSIATWGLRHWC